MLLKMAVSRIMEERSNSKKYGNLLLPLSNVLNMGGLKDKPEQRTTIKGDRP